MTRREHLRKITLEEIKSIARQQMAETGTATVSLSAIARQMEMSAPALYRYFPSRDDLVTVLIVEAFDDLADALEEAAQRPAGSYGEQLLNVILTYRAWALARPEDFALIYGNPIPGYEAPAEVTRPAAQRGFAVILSILAAAYRAGELQLLPEHLHLPPAVQTSLAQLEETGAFQLSTAVIYLGVVGWYRIHGMIMLELFHHTQPLVNDTEAFYRHEVESLLKSFGLIPGNS
jgi:AcrR family transcriptional regulator